MTADRRTGRWRWRTTSRGRAAPDLPVCVEVLPGANISAGRNRAIELAQGDIIVVTDGGVVLQAAWLARLVAVLEERADGDAPADVAAGFFVAAPQSSFELAMGATVLPAVEDIGAGHVFALQPVGGFPPRGVGAGWPVSGVARLL